MVNCYLLLFRYLGHCNVPIHKSRKIRWGEKPILALRNTELLWDTHVLKKWVKCNLNTKPIRIWIQLFQSLAKTHFIRTFGVYGTISLILPDQVNTDKVGCEVEMSLTFSDVTHWMHSLYYALINWNLKLPSSIWCRSYFLPHYNSPWHRYVCKIFSCKTFINISEQKLFSNILGRGSVSLYDFNRIDFYICFVPKAHA